MYFKVYGIKPNTTYTMVNYMRDIYWMNRIIECNENNICTVNHALYTNNNEYDDSKNKEIYTFTTDTETKYMVVQYIRIDKQDMTQNDVSELRSAIFEGSFTSNTKPEYEPYHKYKVPVTVSGANIMNESDLARFDNWKTKEYGETAGGMSRFRIYCKPNTSYTIQIENANSSILFVGTASSTTIQASKIWQIISADTGYFYIRANVYNQTKLDALVQAIGKIMIHEGAYTATTMPPYEPYHEPKTYNIFLDEPLRKVGDYADYIDFKKGKVVRKVVELNLLSQHVAELYNYNGMVGIRTIPILRERMNKRGGKCDRVESGNIGHSFKKNSMWLGVNSLIIYWIGILDTLGISTINEFKEWLDNNPTYIYYGIDAPVEEDISLPSLKAFKGTTIISVDTTIQPSNIKTKYIRT